MNVSKVVLLLGNRSSKPSICLVRGYFEFLTQPPTDTLLPDNVTQKLLCGNVKKFPIAKNGYAHRVQHTRISQGVNFCTSSSLIFEDF